MTRRSQTAIRTGLGSCIQNPFVLFAVILALTLLQLMWQGRKLMGGPGMAGAAREERR